jgi:hypothetical protein
MILSEIGFVTYGSLIFKERCMIENLFDQLKDINGRVQTKKLHKFCLKLMNLHDSEDTDDDLKINWL